MLSKEAQKILQFHAKLAAKSANTVDLHKLLESINKEVLEFINASSGSIMIHNPEEKCLQLYVSSSHPIHGQQFKDGPVARIPIGKGVAGEVFTSGKPVIVSKASDLKDSTKLKRKGDPGSFLSMPLKINRRTIGVLNLNRVPEQPAFSNDDLKRLKTVDTLIASLIEKESFLNTINQNKTEIEGLYSLSCILSDSSNFQKSLNNFLKELGKLLKLERSAIIQLSSSSAPTFSLDQIKDGFNILAAKHISSNQIQQIFKSVSARLKHQLLSSLSESGENPFNKEPLTLAFDENGEPRELFCIPLMVDGKPSHMLLVSRKYQKEDLEDAPRHYRFLYLVSQNLGMALEREEMIQRIKEDQEMLLENATRNRVFLEISKDLTSTLDPYVILQKAFNQFRHIISFSSISILLFDDLDNTYRLIIQPEYPISNQYKKALVDEIQYVFSEFPAEPGLSDENLNKPVVFKPQVPNAKALKEFKQTLNLPIILGDKVSGLIHLAKQDSEPFTRHELDITSQFTGIFITSIKNALIHKRTEKLAFTDPLTELFNHRYFQETLNQEFVRAKRYSKPLSLMVIDIDFFKKFNDTYGHLVGDKVLRHVAKIFQHSVREQIDTVARYGGEEFGVILPETPLKGAVLFAERIREAVESSKIPHEGKELSVTLSIGVSCTEVTDCHKTSDLVESADIALYSAKDGGRNQVKPYTESRVKNA